MTIKSKKSKALAVVKLHNQQIIHDADHDPSPTSLIALALEKGSGIETIERLVALEKSWKADKAREAYAADFVRMKPKLPLVIRKKTNDQTKSKYAALEDINQQVDPILNEFGFGTSAKITEQTLDSVTILVTLLHKGGHSESTPITLPIDDKGMQGTVNKTKIHGVASTLMYGRRLGTCAILNISTGDDNDGQTMEMKSPEDKMRDKISKCGTRPQVNKIWVENPKMQATEWFKKAIEDRLMQLGELKTQKVDMP